MGDATLSKPILVTGGAGFIGSHLTESLVRRGMQVRVLDDFSTGNEENLEAVLPSGQVELTRGSVRDEEVLRPLMAGCSHVFHLAASVGVGAITARPLESMENNLEGVQSLFRVLRAQTPPPRVILFSSSEVYGKSGEVPLREESDLQLGPTHVFRWSYAAAKVVGEYQALCEHRKYGTPVTIVRCFNTSGPRQISTYGMVIPRFLEQALRGDPITVYGDGSQTRCFSYVEDVVEDVLRLMDHPGAVGRAINVGSDRETSVLALAHRIRELTGSSSPIQMVPFREIFGDSFQEIPRRVPDLSRIRDLLGTRPHTSLEDLLASTLAWYRSRNGGAPAASGGGSGTRKEPGASSSTALGSAKLGP